MTTITASPMNDRSDWQPGYIPRLAYRNPVPQGESLLQRDLQIDPILEKRPNVPAMSIKEIREAAQRQTSTSTARASLLPVPQQPQKSKRSFFAGLLATEPTKVAMAQVAQQLEAQYGAVSPVSIPHVSSRKMPSHVPQVNTKWDGIPDTIKTRERIDKERAKYEMRNSLHPQTPHGHMLFRRSSMAGSTAETWDSRSTGSRPVFQDNASNRPGSIYSTSSDNSARSSQQTTPVLTQPFTSLSPTRSPETSPYHMPETNLSPVVQQSLQSSQSISTQSTSSSGLGQGYIIKTTEYCVNTVYESGSSSATTPPERSPLTPAISSDEERVVPQIRGEASYLMSANFKNSNKFSSVRRTSSSKSPHGLRRSSKAGLDSQLNDIVAPWESQRSPDEVTTTKDRRASIGLRARGRLFGKEKK